MVLVVGEEFYWTVDNVAVIIFTSYSGRRRALHGPVVHSLVTASQLALRVLPAETRLTV